MNSRIYEYLLAIEEEQNISRAAARCLLSQPALSQQLKIFEEKLGFPVFARSKSAILPTERGKIVLETAKQIAKTEPGASGCFNLPEADCSSKCPYLY